MNIAQTIPIAETWGMHGSGGWWILGAAVMMLFMGGMMWMMMRGGMGRGRGTSSERLGSDQPGGQEQTPAEVLERRFAEGELSVEEYRERRDVLANGARTEQGRARDNERQPVPDTSREEDP